MTTFVPPEFSDVAPEMKATHDDIVSELHKRGYTFPEYPTLDKGNCEGAAAAKAHPMQGILKYHGLADWQWRTAFLPSVSVTNDAAYSITHVTFDPEMKTDEAWIGGKRASGRDLQRVTQTLDAVRTLAQIESKALVKSKNVVVGGKTGKGLGTSASGSAALALAAIAAAFGTDAASNLRFVSCLSRLLAGSGCRSAAGGVSLWLSFPGIAHEDSFAIRLDDKDQLREMRLITIPLDSRIGLKTEQAHEDAPRSALFKCWMRNRKDEALRAIDATQKGDWLTLAQQAERDSIFLHSVTMSGGNEHKLFAWEPENIALFRLCDELRAEGVPVYFSTDTGPTMVLMLHKRDVLTVATRVREAGFDAIEGNIAGGAKLVSLDEAGEVLGM